MEAEAEVEVENDVEIGGSEMDCLVSSSIPIPPTPPPTPSPTLLLPATQEDYEQQEEQLDRYASTINRLRAKLDMTEKERQNVREALERVYSDNVTKNRHGTLLYQKKILEFSKKNLCCIEDFLRV